MSGIYIHVPFCSSFCIYCDFYSVTECAQRGLYMEALEKEIIRRKDEIKGVPRTIYIGGGTPSLLSSDQLETLVAILRKHFVLDNVEEFTMEVNPDDITPEYASNMFRLGINRVSMGVQSFDDKNLKWMNRRHTSAQAEEAFRVLRRAGFDNISMDLIFGYKRVGVSDEDAFASWVEDVKRMIELRPEHISAYQMSIEPGSILARMKDYQEPSQEYCSECYYKLLDLLEEGGYHHYEVSNFSLPGYCSRHNSSYWERIPYVGFGPAAHSFDGEGRCWNPEDLGEYIAKSATGWGGENMERLTDEEALEEKVMLGLRKISGVSLTEEEYRELRENAEHLAAKGLINLDPDLRHISIPREHLFISDSIIAQII